MWLRPAPMDIGGWLGAANLFSTWASFYSRAFEIPAPDCRCHCEVSGGGSAATAASLREAGDAPGLEVALERAREKGWKPEDDWIKSEAAAAAYVAFFDMDDRRTLAEMGITPTG